MKVLKKVVLPLVAAALMLVAVILVACASMKAHYTMGVEVNAVFSGALWGIKEVTISSIQGSGTQSVGPYGPAVLPLIGWILVLVGLIGLCVGAFLVKDAKLSKCVVLCCALLVVVGGVFQFFALNSLASSFAKVDKVTVEKELELLKEMNASVPLCTVGGILAIVGGVIGAVPPFLPEK